MQLSPQGILAQIDELLSQRAQFYEAGVQTTILSKEADGYRNLLTRFSFEPKGGSSPSKIMFDYSEGTILRRQLPLAEFDSTIKALVGEGVLHTGIEGKSVGISASFSPKERRFRSEWSKWPADILIVRDNSNASYASSSYKHFVALNAPYYPSLENVLLDFFGFTSLNWTNYFDGQVALVLPDYRARISKFTLGLGYLRAEIECPFLQPTDFSSKVYANNLVAPLANETIALRDRCFEVNLSDKADFASVALLWNKTGELLDEKTFKLGAAWSEAEFVVETTQPEIDQLLAVGESETIEFREMLNDGKPLRLAKTAVAFANTKGGVVVFGVNDDHQVVGFDKKGAADTITDILRAHCDPPPNYKIEKVKYQDKPLLLVRVAESTGLVHTVKDFGPFIRSNATNRPPTSREIEFLSRRQSLNGTSPASPF